MNYRKTNVTSRGLGTIGHELQQQTSSSNMK